MIEGLRRACNIIPVWMVDKSRRAAGWVVAAAILGTLALFDYTASYLSFDTNTVNMIDPHLPFRKRQAEFDKAFPQLNNLIVVVIDADTPDRAQDAADALTAKLRGDPKLFSLVYEPGGGSFWEHNGLLYLDPPELSDLANHLAAAQPFLGTVSRDPSLRGLFSLLDRALEEKLSSSSESLLATIFERISDAVEGVIAGRPRPLSWQSEVLGHSEAAKAEKRSFVLAQARLDYRVMQPGHQALETIRAFARDLHLDEAHGVRVRLTGQVPMSEDELESVADSARVTTVLSFVLVCLLLLAGFRSSGMAAWLLATLFMGLVWMAAFATWALGALNLISVTFIVLFIGLGVDFGIQFGMRYREERTHGDPHPVALGGAAAGLCNALMLAAMSAAISFFCFIPTAYLGLAQLGFLAGISMFVALFATLTVLPALLTLTPVRLQPRPMDLLGFQGLGNWVQRHRWAVINGAVVVLAGTLILLPRLTFDFNPLNLRDPNSESVATFRDLLRDPNTSPYTIDILSPSLDAAEKLAARLKALPTVDKAVTLASYVPEQQEEKLGIIDDTFLFLETALSPPEHLSPPTETQQIASLEGFIAKALGLTTAERSAAFVESAQRLARSLQRLETLPGWPGQVLGELQRSILSDLPSNLERLRKLLSPNRITLADLPPDLRERYLTPDGRAHIEVFPKMNLRNNKRLKEFVASVQTVAPEATGAPVTLVESGKVVVQAAIQAAVSAVVAVLIFLIVMLRSLRETLLIFLPLFLAACLTAATSVLLKLPFNFANVIALPLMLGIAVAFGIYLVTRKRAGMTVDELFHSSTPRAVLYSGLTTMASFGTLAISRHRGMSSMGLLVTFALTYALFCTLVVLPAVMAVLEARQGKAHKRSAEFSGALERGDPPGPGHGPGGGGA
jgi:hopanoid biosynthesis associated RND transporter like protein HpnN